jgi:glycosyltransferase involved in cell wall biosynthesis
MRRKPDRIVYAVGPSGHRESYANLFRDIFDLTPLIAGMDRGVRSRLVAADALFFATIDDHIISFLLISIWRSIRLKRTVGLFLRPHACFSSACWASALRLRLFSALRLLPGLTIATIVPHDVAPEFARVSSIGLHDPQLWDAHDGSSLQKPRHTPIASEVRGLAQGRPILCWFGQPAPHKGFALLAEALARHPRVARDVCVVLAGSASPDDELVAKFVEAGGVHLNRRLDDAEWESLYGVSDCIWACYAPNYDQASGIFGRAFQFGVPSIVRRGSQIHELAKTINYDVLPVEFDADDVARVIASLRAAARMDGARETRSILLSEWRRTFVAQIDAALSPAKGGRDWAGTDRLT